MVSSDPITRTNTTKHGSAQSKDISKADTDVLALDGMRRSRTRIRAILPVTCGTPPTDSNRHPSEYCNSLQLL